MSSNLSLLLKIITLGALILIMLIPMTMVMGIVEERSYYQANVISSVADSSSKSQTVTGPFIVIPYTKSELVIHNKQQVRVPRQYLHYILPKELDVDGKADITPRHIGIYQAQVYQSDLIFKGIFESTALSALNQNNSDDEQFQIGEPYLVVLISDTRGIMQVPTITINKIEQGFEPGTNETGLRYSEGIHSMLSLEQLITKSLSFEFKLNLQGTKELSVVPVGRSTNYTLAGNWPHPNFMGYTLPINRTISEDGFEAKWQSSWYSNNINSLFVKDLNLSNNDMLCSYSSECFPSFNVNFVETVDQYQMVERAVKYDILFIVLTFVCFFIFEMLKQLRIHPVQYLLVGMALTIFYLLLLALSEHIGFLLAYITGAVACSSLIGVYLSSVLKSVKRGTIFSTFLLVLYTVLYFVMISEGNALLLGSTLLFFILAGIMLLTRNINWYKVSQAHFDKKQKNSLPKVGQKSELEQTVTPI